MSSLSIGGHGITTEEWQPADTWKWSAEKTLNTLFEKSSAFFSQLQKPFLTCLRKKKKKEGKVLGNRVQKRFNKLSCKFHQQQQSGETA